MTEDEKQERLDAAKELFVISGEIGRLRQQLDDLEEKVFLIYVKNGDMLNRKEH